jgi:hypothetical protein
VEVRVRFFFAEPTELALEARVACCPNGGGGELSERDVVALGLVLVVGVGEGGWGGVVLCDVAFGVSARVGCRGVGDVALFLVERLVRG